MCVYTQTINMEDEFLSLGLDIIGLGVFNYDFGSITNESPVIKVCTHTGTQVHRRAHMMTLDRSQMSHL